MIFRNSAICLSCNTEIESKHRHDYIRCPCGSLAVDGGKEYLKRSAKDFNKVKETSVFIEAPTPERLTYEDKIEKCHRYGLCCIEGYIPNKFDTACAICPIAEKAKEQFIK